MNIFKQSLFAVLLLIVITSCKRDYNDSKVIGPTNIAGSENFTCGTLTTSTASPNFTLPIPFSFGSTFNETVTWKIVLTGLRSTATKSISGTSSVINISNSVWSGNHDGLYYFETGENVRADLIISGKTEPCSSITFTITKAVNYRLPTATFQLDNSNRITYNTDFEPVNSSSTGAINSFPNQFNIGAQTLAIKQTDAIRAPEGEYFLRIIGTSTQPNGFFVGGLQHRKDATAGAKFLPVTWTDPHELYLNVWVRGIDHLPDGCKPYATLNFECHEDDRGDLSSLSNCSTPGSTDHFCPATEDSWVFKIPIAHIGWKLFSCKYSDLNPSEDFANGGFGNKKLEPQKVCRVQLGLVSSPPFNKVSADVDFACFTYGAPLDPNK